MRGKCSSPSSYRQKGKLIVDQNENKDPDSHSTRCFCSCKKTTSKLSYVHDSETDYCLSSDGGIDLSQDYYKADISFNHRTDNCDSYERGKKYCTCNNACCKADKTYCPMSNNVLHNIIRQDIKTSVPKCSLSEDKELSDSIQTQENLPEKLPVNLCKHFSSSGCANFTTLPKPVDASLQFSAVVTNNMSEQRFCRSKHNLENLQCSSSHCDNINRKCNQDVAQPACAPLQNRRCYLHSNNDHNLFISKKTFNSTKCLSANDGVILHRTFSDTEAAGLLESCSLPAFAMTTLTTQANASKVCKHFLQLK